MSYLLTSTGATLFAGQTVIIRLSTPIGIEIGTLVPYTITGVTSGDLDGASLTGNIEITGNRYGELILKANSTLSSDKIMRVALTEFPQISTTVIIYLYSDGEPGTVQGEPEPTAAEYDIAASAIEVNENSTVAFSISTNAVADGTLLYWTIAGTYISGADFNPTSNLYGSVTVTGSSANFSLTLNEDSSLEGIEFFIAQIRTASTTGPIVAVSPNIAIIDTSTGITIDPENGKMGSASSDSSKPAYYVNGTWYKVSGTAIPL